MRAKFGPTTRSELIARLRELGFVGPQIGGRHEFMAKDKLKVRIPNPHKTKDIGVGLLSTVLSQAGITKNEWLGTPAAPADARQEPGDEDPATTDETR